MKWQWSLDRLNHYKHLNALLVPKWPHVGYRGKEILYLFSWYCAEFLSRNKLCVFMYVCKLKLDHADKVIILKYKRQVISWSLNLSLKHIYFLDWLKNFQLFKSSFFILVKMSIFWTWTYKVGVKSLSFGGNHAQFHISALPPQAEGDLRENAFPHL